MLIKQIANTIVGGIHNTIKQTSLCSILFIYAYTTGSTMNRHHTIKLIIGKVIKLVPPICSSIIILIEIGLNNIANK